MDAQKRICAADQIALTLYSYYKALIDAGFNWQSAIQLVGMAQTVLLSSQINKD